MTLFGGQGVKILVAEILNGLYNNRSLGRLGEVIWVDDSLNIQRRSELPHSNLLYVYLVAILCVFFLVVPFYLNTFLSIFLVIFAALPSADLFHLFYKSMFQNSNLCRKRDKVPCNLACRAFLQEVKQATSL